MVYMVLKKEEQMIFPESYYKNPLAGGKVYVVNEDHRVPGDLLVPKGSILTEMNDSWFHVEHNGNKLHFSLGLSRVESIINKTQQTITQL